VESDSLSVVVPVYNEEENISALLEQLQAALREWRGEVEFLLVDDGSTDTTLVIREFALRTSAVIWDKPQPWRRAFIWPRAAPW
jgi:glycosyltransferase involved in cell wall biosynthesis